MNEVLGLLGLAAKASKVVSGTEAVKEALEKNQVYLLFQAEEMNPNVLKSHLRYLENMTICRDYTGEELSRAIGRQNRRILAITDEGLANALLKKL